MSISKCYNLKEQAIHPKGIHENIKEKKGK